MASLQEVARRARVSIATVSRVLNKSNKVVPETRAVVEQALRDLDYRPSRVARRLRMKDGRAHLVGLIIPDIQNPFYAEIARGVEDAAYKSEYALLLCNSDENLEKERFYLEVMRAESVDGIVLPPEPEAWRTGAELHEGSWWEEWTRWAAERSGGQREPPSLGSERHPPLAEAPGTYILT